MTTHVPRRARRVDRIRRIYTALPMVLFTYPITMVFVGFATPLAGFLLTLLSLGVLSCVSYSIELRYRTHVVHLLLDEIEHECHLTPAKRAMLAQRLLERLTATRR